MHSPIDPGLFELDPSISWVMHCAEGPVPRASVEAARAALDEELRPWALSIADWLGAPARVKAAAAAVLGGAADDWALANSTSGALTTLAHAFPWRPGDEVLLPLGEFPTNYWPWRALEPLGVTVREVPLWPGHRAGRAALESAPPPPGVDPEGALLAALRPATRVLATSWVRFQDGLRLELRRLAAGCAAAGIAFVIDGIQGAGTLPLDLAGLPGEVAFASGVHKGLLAPQGAGLLYTAPALRARLRPVGSWLSVEGGADFGRANSDFDRAWLADGRRFEQGGSGKLILAPLEASLRVLEDARPARIAAHVDALQGALLEALARSPAWSAEVERLAGLRGDGRLGSILALHHGGRGGAGLQALLRDGLARGVFATAREGYLRIALHGFHGAAVVEPIAAWLAG